MRHIRLLLINTIRFFDPPPCSLEVRDVSRSANPWKEAAHIFDSLRLVHMQNVQLRSRGFTKPVVAFFHHFTWPFHASRNRSPSSVAASMRRTPSLSVRHSRTSVAIR